MDRKNVFVCVLGMALVLGFAGIASAQDEDSAALEDQITVEFDEAPYVDADGNIDYELAKDYAELVDSYTDENGTKREVWLDEFGGHMWEESLTTDGILGLEELFVPNYVLVYRSGLSYVYYAMSGSSCGPIWYAGGCGTNCYKWYACSDNSVSNCRPIDVTKVAALGNSDDDYCDANYVGYYHFPGGSGWIQAENDDCGTVAGAGWYTLSDDDPNGTTDYSAGEKMVRWHYHVSGAAYYTDVYYYGVCII